MPDMARITRMERQERLATCEALMQRTFSVRRVEQEMEARFGIHSRTARAYVRAVRRKWAIRAEEDPDAVRREILARLQELYLLAVNRRRTLISPTGETVEVDDPDVRNAAMILRRIGEVTGAIGPFRREGSDTAGALPQGLVQILVSDQGPTAIAALQAAAKAEGED